MNVLRLCCFLVIFFPGLTSSLAGQDTATSDSSLNWIAFPIAFASPESGLGLGGGALATFQWRGDSSIRQSYLQSTLSYTTKDQLLTFASWELFTPSDLYLYGELGYYRYSYLFHGIGNSTDFNSSEKFSFNLFRSKITALRHLGLGHYLGLRWFYDYWTDLRLKPQGELEQQIPGSQGAVTSSIGMVYQLDTRQPVYFPRRGLFLSTSILAQAALTGATYENQRWTFTGNYYWSPFARSTLAFQYQQQHLRGTVAFYDQALLGGFQTLRGYYLGRFRGQHLQVLRGAWRQAIFQRWAAVIFAGTGRVSPEFSRLWKANLHPAWGFGIRYRPLESSDLNVRLDVAWGDGSAQLYFGVGEAF